MDNNSTILNELREISPVIAAIGNLVPFAVPEGYFKGLPARIMERIAIEDHKIKEPQLHIDKAATYQAPEGYFEGLASSILNRIKATEAVNPKEELDLISPLLGGVEKKNPFASPAGFFEDFSSNVLSGVQAIEFVNEELENLSPLMNGLKDKNVFSVPANYFENFAGTVINKINTQPAKVVSISFGRKIVRYAAAAVIAGILVTGAYKFINPSTGSTASVDSFANVSEKEMEGFLNNNTLPLADTSAAEPAAITEENEKDLLADVSDEELQQYLEQHGGTVANTYNN
jgi:hypothetical protein